MGDLVMGIDSGLRVTGLCCLVGDRVMYRGSVRTPSAWPDKRRRSQICSDVVAAIERIPELLRIGSIWVEGYEYQGQRTHTQNAIRCSLLIGEIVGSLHVLGHSVGIVDRTVWGRCLGIKTNAGQKLRLHKLQGLKLKNEHERDAACVALYGQRHGAQMEMVG